MAATVSRTGTVSHSSTSLPTANLLDGRIDGSARRVILNEAPDRGYHHTEALESRVNPAEAPDAGEGILHSHIDDF